MFALLPGDEGPHKRLANQTFIKNLSLPSNVDKWVTPLIKRLLASMISDRLLRNDNSTARNNRAGASSRSIRL
jgi:hypothetical protein